MTKAYNAVEYLCTNPECRFYDEVRTASLPIVGFEMHLVGADVRCSCGFSLKRVDHEDGSI